MLYQRIFDLNDQEAVRELVRNNGWATLITATDRGNVVVSHLPVLLEEDREGVSIVGHLGRPDEVEHQLGGVDATLVIQGPHGYVSPSWYGRGGSVPTWNFVVAHLHGRPEVLDAEETFDVLARTVERVESVRPDPWRLDTEAEYARRIAPGTIGFRLVPTRIVAKAKLSQDKPLEVADRVTEALATDRVHASPALAEAMRRAVRP